MLINNESKRVYVGSSSNYLSRMWGHYENAFVWLQDSNELYDDLRRLGVEGFTLKPLKACETMEEALDLELRWIAKFVNAGRPCYNIRSTKNYKQFPDDRANPYITDTQPQTPRKPRKTLTLREVSFCIMLAGEGITQSKLADLFDVSQAQVCKAIQKAAGISPTPRNKDTNTVNAEYLESVLEPLQNKGAESISGFNRDQGDNS